MPEAHAAGKNFRYVRTRLDTAAGRGHAAPGDTCTFGLEPTLDGFAARPG
ncbi:hypothetical protein [Actinoplanes teichomyceticus]|uniref:Uncharacterized protein n=1 Tax=Actinoplanes teichomyceticus TaxID=1867 RepID=A0A561WC32_ACTTI|nr:hypothetical protein [Actinoplanes teichomyceticus]TWG21428.1 hypothetical protein FHX34_103967 [Actinoplanes teichomyceticus]GIF16598.1 hypothetical protein Ate01nite_66300 [Actinoplanes teichomyceticus]